MKTQVINQIKDEPKFRLRANKNSGIAYLLSKEHPSLENVPPKVLTDIVYEVLYADRIWRRYLADNPEYRGSDYGQKRELEEKTQIDLGYSMGFNEDLKKLQALSINNKNICTQY